MLSFEDANRLIDAVILCPRVSSQSQEDGTSLGYQNHVLNNEFSKLCSIENGRLRSNTLISAVSIQLNFGFSAAETGEEWLHGGT